MVPIIQLLIILFSSFGLGLIPFAGPSNLLIASTWALSLGYTDVGSLAAIGLVVALGAAFAKGIHYMVTFFVSGHLSEKRQQRLNADAVKVKRWAFLLLFAAAATPIPDEPVVIPLGLMKYSPAKFFTAFFLGKLLITVLGAFLGAWTNHTFSEWLSPEAMIVLSIALTVVVTVILLKVDVGKLAEKYLKRKPKSLNPDTEYPPRRSRIIRKTK
jgi:membrane protein DedA with SNARE-associated domain